MYDIKKAEEALNRAIGGDLSVALDELENQLITIVKSSKKYGKNLNIGLSISIPGNVIEANIDLKKDGFYVHDSVILPIEYDAGVDAFIGDNPNKSSPDDALVYASKLIGTKICLMIKEYESKIVIKAR
jgi:hypothetical protein